MITPQRSSHYLTLVTLYCLLVLPPLCLYPYPHPLHQFLLPPAPPPHTFSHTLPPLEVAYICCATRYVYDDTFISRILRLIFPFLQNGGLTREHIRDTYASRSWDTFNSQVLSTPPGNNNRLGFYFTLKEIIPDGVQGDYVFENGESVDIDSFPRESHARAVLESQLLSIRVRLIDTLHTATAATTTTTTITSQANNDANKTVATTAGLKRVIMTGGSSHNPVMQQLVADVLGLPVFIASSGGGSAASGGALLAKYAWWRRDVEERSEARTTTQTLPLQSDAHNLDQSSQTPSSAAKFTNSGQTAPSFEEMRKSFGDLNVEQVAVPALESERLYGRIADTTFRSCEKAIVEGTA